MENVNNFTRYLIEKDIEHFFDICDCTESERVKFRLLNVQLLVEEFEDCIRDYVSNHSVVLDEHAIGHEGGDEWVFEDGIWYTNLHEIEGWYYWQEPEGQTYGLYSSLEDALKDESNLY